MTESASEIYLAELELDDTAMKFLSFYTHLLEPGVGVFKASEQDRDGDVVEGDGHG